MLNPEAQKLITEDVQRLHKALTKYTQKCPRFDGEGELVIELGTALGKLEVDLHHKAGCWELATPKLEE